MRIQGLAATWSKFIAGDGSFMKFSMVRSFHRFTKSAASESVPLFVDHDSSLVVPTFRSSLRTDGEGLVVSFDIDDSTARGRAAALAVEHGFLPHLSVNIDPHEADDVIDADGILVTHVIAAGITEISLTANPANPRTWVYLAGQPMAKSRSWPADPKDKALLQGFLRSCGMEVPTTWLPTAKSRSSMLVTDQNGNKPLRPFPLSNKTHPAVRKLMTGPSREYCTADIIPGTGGKTLSDLATPEERQWLIDAVLDFTPSK